MQPLPFDILIDPKTKRMQTRKVDVESEAYECARRYMIRLEREDFEIPKKLQELAAAVNMSADQFRKRFGYLVGIEPLPEGVK